MTSSAPASFEEGWSQLESAGIDVLLDFVRLDCETRQSKLFSPQVKTQLATLIYNLDILPASAGSGDLCMRFYEGHGEVFRKFLTEDVLRSLREKRRSSGSGEYFLQAVNRAWLNHAIMNRCMWMFFQYLDQHHVPKHQLTALRPRADGLFRSILFDPVKADVTAALLDWIEQDRCGNVNVDRGMLKTTLELYVAMGRCVHAAAATTGTDSSNPYTTTRASPPRTSPLSCYVDDFEAPFLASTRAFYRLEAEAWSKEEHLVEYMLKVDRCMQTEEQRCQQCMHSASTAGRLQRVLEEECVEGKLDFLFEDREEGGEGCDCRSLFVHESNEDLGRLYLLLSRLPKEGALIRLSKFLTSHVSDLCASLIAEHAADQADAGAGAGTATKAGPKNKAPKDASQLIQRIAKLHEKYHNAVRTHFRSNMHFEKALQSAFSEATNLKVGDVLFAVVLAGYADQLLKSESKGATAAGPVQALSEAEIESKLDSVVGLFTYVKDKDIFGEAYRRLLSTRLMNNRSASDEMEKVMVGKLKMKCGSSFTYHMEGMLNDYALSKGGKMAFMTHCRGLEQTQRSPLESGEEVTVTVLTQGNWPTFVQFEKVLLPEKLKYFGNEFLSYYKRAHEHRRLLWVYSLGSVEMKARFGAGREYTMSVATLQAAVLMLFNEQPATAAAAAAASTADTADVKTFDHIKRATDMPEEALKRVMHSLCAGKHRVLRLVSDASGGGSSSSSKAPAGGKSSAPPVKSIKIRTTDSFYFNAAFRSESNKFRIPIASLEETDSATDSGKANSNAKPESRKLAIEAAVVRILKARKTLPHTELIGMVLAQLTFFQPDPKDIKKVIESLIERAYLERAPDDPKCYQYLA